MAQAATATGTAGAQATGGVAGNYYLRVQIGSQDILTNPQSFYALDVVEYIDRMLPAFTITFRDPTGFLTNKLFIDKSYSTMTLVFSNTVDATKSKDMKFRIYRRFPASYTGVANTITMTGLLDVPGLFSPTWQRGWNKKTISSILSQLATEMKIQNKDIDTFTEPISLVQPNWSNATLLRYLASRVINSNRDGGMFAFIDTYAASTTNSKWAKGSARLTFKSLNSFLKQPSKYTFQVTKEPPNNVMPIYNFEGVDNFELVNIMGVEKQRYNYFDYDTGKQVDDELVLQDEEFKSLSKYIACDTALSEDGLSQDNCGRTNELVPDFEPVMRGKYFKKVNTLVKQWITTRGVTDIRCGDIIYIASAPPDVSQMMNYQYTGYWMVERVVHHISSTYMTKLLITRPGIDTDQKTTLLKATNPIGVKSK